MREDSQQDITELLNLVSRGDSDATERLLPLIDAELRGLAAAHLARSGAGHSVQPTALIDDAYMKLVGSPGASWASRGHFYSLASKVIRTHLVDHTRMKNAEKRGGFGLLIPLNVVKEALVGRNDPATELLEVHVALEKLEQIDPELAHLIEMRYFGQMEVRMIATVLGMAKRTVERRLKVAMVWLREELSE